MGLEMLVRRFEDLVYEIGREFHSVIYIDEILKLSEEVLESFELFKKNGVWESSSDVLSAKECMYFYQAILEMAKEFVNTYENESLLEREVIAMSIFKDTLINGMIAHLSNNPKMAAEMLGELLHTIANA
jgi:hypothetical protein